MKNTNYRGKLSFDKFKFLDFSKTVYLNNDESVQYVNTANDNSFLYVLNEYKNYIAYCEKQKITQRGSVISKQCKYYYVYGEEGRFWLVFEVNIVSKDDLIPLVIKNFMYYTKFHDEKILKKDEFETILLCSEKEIDDIKVIRKNYKMTVNKQKKSEKKEFTSLVDTPILKLGSVIKLNENSYENFVVIKIIDNMVCCVGQADFQKSWFNKKDVIVIENDKTMKMKNIISNEENILL